MPSSTAPPAGSRLEGGTFDTAGHEHGRLRTVLMPVLAVYAVTTTVYLAVGLFLTHVVDPTWFGRRDLAVSEWFAAQRTETLNSVAHVVANASDWAGVIPICVVLAVVGRLVWHRWREAGLIVGALLFEKAVFLSTTFLVDRPRPPVGQIGGNPPTSSFPSGHVAAAVALYMGLFVVLGWHVHGNRARALLFAVLTLPVVAVALARLELGMHHLTDVFAGAVLGVISILVVRHAQHTLWPADDRGPRGLARTR